MIALRHISRPLSFPALLSTAGRDCVRRLVVLLQFGLECVNDAAAGPLHRSLPGAVVVHRPLRDAQPKEPLARKITPCGNKLKNSHGRTLKENCGIRKKRLDKLRNPQHCMCMTATATQKMSRNEISRAASDIQDNARKQGSLARCNDNARKQAEWATIEGRAQRLANEACESRWTLKMLRCRLVELRGEVSL